MKITILYIAAIFSFASLKANANQFSDSVIISTSNPGGWMISTNNSVYQLILTKENEVQQAYYGPKAQLAFHQKKISAADEIPVRGAFPTKTPLLEVVFPDNVRDAELTFVNAEVLQVEGRQTLKIIQKDKYYPLEITSFIRVLPEFDILEKWVTVKNTGKKNNIKIENLQSASIHLPPDAYDLTHMAGEWGHEFQLRNTALTEGVKTLQARDFKSFANPNWFMVRPAKENEDISGSAWFGTLQYSGNWRIDFDKAFNGKLQITGGINFWDTDWTLKPGTTFETPRFIIGYTRSGSEGAAQHLTAYIRKTVLPASFRDKPRPVLYNSWYATAFNVNEEQQLALAKIAKETGVELFVIDDGWFKGRNDDHAALGDWTVDRQKFPNGLQPMIKKINDMGMDFGIWVEPEMVNPNSDLYRAHPDWVFHFPNRTRHEGRHQLMLNLAREDVYQYLLRSLSALLQENNIRFIKWDHNRTLSEPGWPDAPASEQREVRIRYITNLYRLIDALRARFPNVLFEDCSSGGGRVDLGMLSRMDQAWASDNTDPVDRIFIQYGYLSAFPANTMVSWITHEDWHSLKPGLAYKFDVAMSGVLGIGYDITKWTDDEKKLAKTKIEQYKEIRDLVQFGTLHRLVSPFKDNKSALQYIAEDRSSAVVFCYNMAEYLNGSTAQAQEANILKLRGLDPGAFYKIQGLNNVVYKGDFLMNIGIAWPVRGAYKSMILQVQKTKQ
ncbi:MAG: alpha-galactosidase [Chitinophagaceae bacterium]|nr:alpha-galactosidase [Chitinophagaceae bacterium]